MIWYWLWCLGDFVARLFTPRKTRDVARVNRDEPCPVCNTRRGALRAVVLKLVEQGRPARPTVFCQHTCAECGARWFERPVVEVSVNDVLASIPRSEAEKVEDDQYGTPKSVTVAGAVN